MKEMSRLGLSFKEYFQNPSLIGVLVVKFILYSVLGWLLVTLGRFLSPPEASTQAFWIAIVLMGVFLLSVMIIGGLFSAGFYSMVKNTIQDGGTSVKEFFPGCKRYGTRFIGYLFVKAIITSILIIPFITATISAGIQSGFTNAQLLTFLFFAVASVLVHFFWLLWAGAIIVFEDEAIFPAMKKSIDLTHSKLKNTFIVLILSLLLVFSTIAVLMAVIIPYEVFVLAPLQPQTPTLTWDFALANTGGDLLVYFVWTTGMIIIMLFIFHTYSTIQKRSTPRPHKARKAVRKKAQKG